MSTTTTLLVDLLIIGIQAAVWLVLLFLSLLGVDGIDISDLDGWEATVGVLYLPLVYPVGVFADHVADTLLSGWRSKSATVTCMTNRGA
jgi:hypothetical protein